MGKLLFNRSLLLPRDRVVCAIALPHNSMIRSVGRAPGVKPKEREGSMRLTFWEIRMRPEFLRRFAIALLADSAQVKASLAAFGLLLWDDETDDDHGVLGARVDALEVGDLVFAWVGAERVRNAVAANYVRDLGSEQAALACLEESRMQAAEVLRSESGAQAVGDVDVRVAYYEFARAAGIELHDAPWGPDGDSTLPVTLQADGFREAQRNIVQRRRGLKLIRHQLKNVVTEIAKQHDEDAALAWRILIGVTLMKSVNSLESLDRGDLEDGFMEVSRLRAVMGEHSAALRAAERDLRPYLEP